MHEKGRWSSKIQLFITLGEIFFEIILQWNEIEAISEFIKDLSILMPF